jgi:ABC-type multidrug transport system fused ATPase/permease subunit
VLLQEWAEDNDRLGRFYTGHWLFFVGMVLLTAWLAVDISTGDSRLVWVVLVFMAMLPLLNAFCDWLSIGVTRSLLATTLQQKGRGAVWRSGLDLLLAVLSLGLLSLAATAFLQALNLLAAAGGGGEVFDLDGLIFKLRHQPWDRELWWVYFTLFSTLLPTFVHGFVGVWSLLGFTWPAKKRQQYIAEIRDGAALGEDSLRAVDIARAFAGRDVLALLLTFFGVAFLLWMLLWGVPGLARSLLPGCWGLR